MTETIESYIREVERWTPGPTSHQHDVTLELTAHLHDAESAGELSVAIADLGTPREAARSLLSGRVPAPAPVWRHALGGLIDIASLFGIGALGFIGYALFGGKGGVSVDASRILFVPRLYCNDPTGAPAPCRTAGQFAFFVMVVAAIFWFVVVLTLLEWRYGRTPGKWFAFTRVISEDGTALDLGQAVIRRLPFFFLGPLQVIDWAFAFFGPKRQRGFDRIARTLVVADARTKGEKR